MREGKTVGFQEMYWGKVREVKRGVYKATDALAIASGTRKVSTDNLEKNRLKLKLTKLLLNLY